MTPTVSVVIPTFNRAVLVIKAVESVLEQTYKDYEVIVVDDGSVDNTREILKPYCQRLRYFYQENRGVSAARNKGVELAKGEWISILDSDDEWLPTKLERQFEAMAALGQDIGACFTDCQFVGNQDLQQTAFELGGLEKRGTSGILDNSMRYILAHHAVIYVPSLLVRKSLINELGGFDEAMVVAEDTDLFFRLTLKTKTKFCFVSEPLVKIDRTPARPLALTELFFPYSDKMFSSKDRMFRKWLASPELVDLETRNRIHESLRSLHYDWMIRKLYQFRFSEAVAKIKQVRELGDSYLRILSTTAFRAGRKLWSSLTRQTPQPE